MVRTIFTFVLILAAVLSRLMPHPPNFAPITALALFGAVYLDRKHTFVVPLAALIVSDYFIGFYDSMVFVYGSFLAIGCLGLWLRSRRTIGTTIGATLAGSVIFFIVTNFGVWLLQEVAYPRTFAGLVECYTAAIPFFRNTIAGDMLYVAALFGLYELAKKVIPSLAVQPGSVKA